MKAISLFLVTLLLGTGSAVSGTSAEEQAQTTQTATQDENSHDLFEVATTYTFESDFRTNKLGHGDSLYNDFTYDHRFLITGKWYFRTGIEYERFDFGGTDNGLPDHLQALYAHLAVEYVVKDYAGAGIELDPGAYFQDNVTSNALDVPWKLFVSFPIKKDKIFGVIGLGGALYQDPIVAPGGGLIWLFNDKLRLEGVFPKPALVYNPSDNWEFRLGGQLLFESFRTDDVLTTQKRLQLRNAIVQYNEVRAGLEVRYDGFKPFRIKAGAGWTVEREFDFFRADQRARLQGAPYVGIGIEARF
jgi:hypothetical protein